MNNSSAKRNLLIRLVLLLLVSLAFISFYLPMMKTWFFSDDIQWIWSSASLHFKEIFFSPEKYRTMASNFTPMLGASFKIDWMLSGMDPTGYSLHSLLSLLAATAALYFFFRLYIAEESALAGILFFLLNPITLSVTGWFSTRHYIDGLFWALLSISFFVRADRKGKLSLSSGIFYVLSSLNKEVYVVLPAIALLLSRESLFKRLKHTLPLWAGLLVYSIWRLWMMKGIGGYPSNEPVGLNAVITLFYKTVKFFSLQWFGDYFIALYLLLLVAFILSLKHIKMLLIFLILCVPILPVTNIFGADYQAGRYFFHLAVFIICALCLLMEYPSLKSRALYKTALFSACLLIILVFVKQDMRISSAMQHERLLTKETAEVFVHSGQQYMKSEQPSWFYEGLRNINRVFYGRDIRTQLVPQENFLRYAAPEKLREIEASGIEVPYDDIARARKRFRKGPLAVKITIENYKLSWDFGPRKDTVYTLLRSHISGLYYNSSELGSQGTYMLGKGSSDKPGIVYIRIFYRSEDGVEVISPEFVLTIPGNEEIAYSQVP
jgi:hypothetical protein